MVNPQEMVNNLEKLDIKQLREELNKLNPSAKKLSDDELQKMSTLLTTSGLSPKKALKVTDETMEGFYAHAYNLYNQGKYQEASCVFRFLMLLDMSIPKYILGGAACLHRQKDYQNAAQLYFLCSIVDPKNPLPPYHATDCYLQLNQPALALITLQMCINAAADQPQYAIIKERAMLLQTNVFKSMAAGK